jgi:hypothetical protein
VQNRAFLTLATFAVLAMASVAGSSRLDAAESSRGDVTGSSREDGILLSSTDYEYLLTQGVQRNNVILQKMSPKELYRLHRSINDEKTQNDTQARSNAVRAVLAEFEGNQQWEKTNPGEFWDGKNRRDSEKPKGNN